MSRQSNKLTKVSLEIAQKVNDKIITVIINPIIE